MSKAGDRLIRSAEAVRAAIQGSTEGWGTWASAHSHVRYFEPAPHKRCKCRCGCGGRATHIGKANGVGLVDGCELSVRRWVKKR